MTQFKLTRFDLETKGVTAQAGEKNTVTVLTARGKRILVEDAHFHTDSSVFLPRDPGIEGIGIDEPRSFSNDAFWETVQKNNAEYVKTAKDGEFKPPDVETQEPNSKVDTGVGGLEAILGALRFLDAHDDHSLLVAGHTDRAGSESHNEELSGARAECVTAVLEGNRTGYVTAAKKHDKTESDGSMLAFAARARQFPCNPADPSKPTSSEIKAFQKAYNDDFGKSIAVDGVVGDETRGAYFDLLEAELVLQAGSVDDLASLRGKLKFVDVGKKFLACGERFPLDRPGEDGVASQANRRVELLFFPPDIKPDLKVKDAPDRVYHQGTFDFQRVDPDTLESAEETANEGDTLELVDEPPPENGAGELAGVLTTEMTKLQENLDPEDQYAFLEPFDESFPEFGRQAIGDFPLPSGDSVLV